MEIKIKRVADLKMAVSESREVISRGLSLQTLTAFDLTSFSSSHIAETLVKSLRVENWSQNLATRGPIWQMKLNSDGSA